MKSIVALAILVFTVTPLFAQNVHTLSESRPVLLLPGLGHHQHPIATTNPEARKFFDQGLLLVYGFNRSEAIRSFNWFGLMNPLLQRG